MQNKNYKCVLRPLALAIACASAGSVHAVAFQTDSGWEGEWNTTLSVGTQVRAEDQDSSLYSAANGAANGKSGGTSGPVDAGNLNYDKGDRFSTIAKFVTDLSMRKGDFGGLVRVKGWYDYTLENEDVNWGSFGSGYDGGKLNDNGYGDLQKFSGLYLLDAYAYNTFYMEDTPIQVRLGRQVVNWGESLFIQGVNQINPLDAPALRRPGTELKEALIPVWMGYVNIGLPAGITMEAFYQLKYESTAVEGCGRYWSVTESAIGQDFGDCDIGVLLGPTGAPLTSAQRIQNGLYLPLVDGEDTRDSGQWGLSFRMPVDAVDGEFGLYFLNYHSRTPFLGFRTIGQGTPDQFPTASLPVAGTNANGVQRGPSWEYPEDIRLYGLSFTTTLGGWSIGSELSYSPNQPAQINGADFLNGVLAGIGPAASGIYEASFTNSAAFVAGWDRYEKTQFQINGIGLYPNVLGANNLTVVGEAGFQWNSIPEGDGERRYGRGFIYGLGSDSSIPEGGSTCSNPVAGRVNSSPEGCKNKGYVTDFAWGYRLRAQLDYNNFLGSTITASPYAFLGHDVDGVSMDGQFNEGRLTSAIGVSFDYNKQHKLDFSYVSFDNSAEYDPLHDRDFYAASYSYSF